MISFDTNGLPYNTLYRDLYKSRAGALAEAREVFVAGADVVGRWRGREQFTVLELGFGFGVNFLATLTAWRADASACRRLHFVSIEAHPADRATLARAHEALGIDGDDARSLRERWPMSLPGLHRIEFAQARVTLTVAIGDVHTVLPRIAAGADAFYLDGFAPARNPSMWDERTCRALARRARPGATLASYTASTRVRDTLASAGFEVSLHAGFADKRHCLRAVYSPRWRTFEAPDPAPCWPRREALVVGAGLAGCAAAAALARRGWRVRMLERSARPATQGSAQTMLADHLHLSPDDNPLARLTRAALTLATQTRHGSTRDADADATQGATRDADATQPTTLGDLPDPAGPGVWRIGRLALAASAQEEERQHETVARLAFPQAFAQAVNRDEASALAGLRLRHGGIWLPLCRTADPGRMCERWLEHALPAQGSGAAPGAGFGAALERLERRGDDWVALDPQGGEIARAPVVVIAAAGDSLRLAGMRAAPLRRVRGQTTLLPGGAIGSLRTVLGGDAYACPLPGGGVLAGATFDDEAELAPSRDADLSNLRRLSRLLAQPLGAEDWADAMLPRARSGSVGFRYVARDRIPLIGALADEREAAARAAELTRNDRLALPTLAGLYGAFGYGSRGLLWATLGAEIVAAALEGEPAPIESDLLGALDPSRFLRQRLRRGRRPR